jgi:hypothetical protein
MWIYDVIESSVFLEGKQHTTYGIACESTVIPDISIHKNLISELVRKLNHSQLFPIHLADVVEDFLVDFHY